MIPDPSRCALVVVDVQNDFCHQDGSIARCGVDTTPVRDAVPAIVAMIELARRHHIPRIYLRVEHDEWSDDPAWLARSGSGGGEVDISPQPLARAGSWGADFYQLQPRPDELVIVKPRHSGFAYTSLALALRAKRRDTVLLTGVATNVCVRATGVDAVAQGFFPILLSDACAAMLPAEHEATVREFPAFYGPVSTTETLRNSWSTLVKP